MTQKKILKIVGILIGLFFADVAFSSLPEELSLPDAFNRICTVRPDFDQDVSVSPLTVDEFDKEKIAYAQQLRGEFSSHASIYSYLMKHIAPLDINPLYFTPARQHNYFYKTCENVTPLHPYQRRQLQVQWGMELVDKLTYLHYSTLDRGLDAAYAFHQEAYKYGIPTADALNCQEAAKELTKEVQLKLDTLTAEKPGFSGNRKFLEEKLMKNLIHFGVQ